jgi:transcriptional regulator with XRE-family HTH domain
MKLYLMCVRSESRLGMIEGADPGLERAFLSLLENGRSDLTLSSLEKLADAFGLTISELMKGL